MDTKLDLNSLVGLSAKDEALLFDDKQEGYTDI